MKKVLSVMLIFALSLFVLGTSDILKAEATEDVTIYLHIHQYDGDYTNSGTGIWDGVNWNNWADTVSTTDDFGGVVEINYTAAEINAVMDEIEFKPTRNVNVDDAANYLAPASVEGKVFADVTSLKDGSKTELHLYYVEGALDFYAIEGADNFGHIFFVYADPTVAANEAAYDAWNMWTWNNGTGGSVDGVDFAADIELMSGDFLIPMKLGVFNVASDADQSSGFIVRTEEWNKQCATDILIDNTSVRGSGALIFFYQADSCELETDYAAWLADVGAKFEMNAGNRFVEGTEIVAPDQLEVTMLMPKNPAALEVGRFQVKDAQGNLIPIVSATTEAHDMVGAYTGGTMCSYGRYKMVLYVNTTLDHSKLGLVGSLNGWDIDNVIPSIGDDDMGNAVFEVCTSSPMGEFKLKYDPDGDGFTWDGELDPEITPNNQKYEISGSMTGLFYIHVSDIQVAPFEQTVNLGPESLVKVFVMTSEDHTKLGLVGNFQGWNPGAAITSVGDTPTGLAAFEFATDQPQVDFKVLFDNDDNGFNWGDTEVSGSANITIDTPQGGDYTIYIDDATDSGMLLDGSVTNVAANKADYTYTEGAACTTPENKLILFVDTALDHTKLGLVGAVQGWDPATALAPIGETASGLVVFEACTTEDTGGYKILFDHDDNGFAWGDFEVTPADQSFDFAGATDSELAFLIGGTNAKIGPFTPTVVPDPTVLYRLIVYVSSDLDHTKLGLVGDIQANDWTPGEAITSIGDDSYGNAIFEVAVDSLTGGFKVLFDSDDNGFNWGDTEVTPNNVTFDMGEETSIMLYIDGTDGSFQEVTIGSELTSLSTTHVTLMFAADTFVWGEDYMVEYLEDEEFIVMPDLFISEYIEGSGNNKAIEIFNPTDAEVDLTAYSVQEWYNTDPGFNTYDLTGTLAAGDVLVLCTDAIDTGTDLEANCDIQFPFPSVVHFNGDDAVALLKDGVVIDMIGDPAEAGGDDFAKDTTLTRKAHIFAGTTTFDKTEWNGADQDTFDTIGAHSVELPEAVAELWIMSETLDFVTSNEFVAGDPLGGDGTFAATPMMIPVQLVNPATPIASLELVDNMGNVIPIDTYAYRFDGPGAFTSDVTCGENEDLLTVHLRYTTNVSQIDQVGLVGSVQGWSPENAIIPSGFDANGNLVFEVCVDTSENVDHAFKILHEGERDSGFAWGDPELTPADVLFTFDGDVTLYIEEGNSVEGSMYHMLHLAEANKLDVTKSYQLRMTDANGFVVYIDLDIDNEAPDIQFTVKPNVDFEINDTETFDYMNYFDVLTAIDNRDGELALEVTSDIDPMTPGTQTFTVKAVDAWMNESTQSFQFTVLDVTEPVITIDDTLPTEFDAGADEPNWADYASTNEGTITVNSSQADMTAEGTFFIIFTATDASGNSASANLEITINATEPVEEPSTGCFSTFGLGSTIVIALGILGGAALLFVRKP